MANPYCLAMVICDGFHQDPTTGKYTILGTFDAIAAESFPVKSRLCIYFAITDGHGPCSIGIQLVTSESGPVDINEMNAAGRVFGIRSKHELSSPLVVLEEAVEVEFIIPHGGLYHCELWANDQVLMSRRFIVQEMPQQGKEKT